MYNGKRIVWYTILVIAGAALFLAGCFEVLDSFWSGMGGGLAAVGAVRLALAARYKKEPDYARQIDISNNDERNRFISGKAKSWTMYLTVIILAVLSIILRAAGSVSQSQICLYVMCGMLVIYWVAYMILSRKY